MMPSRSWPWWTLTGLLLIGGPLVSLCYWLAVLEAGLLPHDKDSISIPLFGSLVLTALIAPVVLGSAWFCLRRYRAGLSLLAWRSDRPWRSLLVTLAWFPAVGLLLLEIVVSLGRPVFWHDYLWPAYLCLWLPWLVGMRAAAIGLDSGGMSR